MITREALVRKLRELGYKFKRQTDRVEIYKRRTDYANVPRRDLVSELNVRKILDNAGCSREDIERFISQAKN